MYAHAFQGDPERNQAMVRMLQEAIGKTEQCRSWWFWLGIELASIAALPEDVIGRAQTLCEDMKAFNGRLEKKSKTNKILMRRKVLLEVCAISLPYSWFISDSVRYAQWSWRKMTFRGGYIKGVRDFEEFGESQ